MLCQTALVATLVRKVLKMIFKAVIPMLLLGTPKLLYYSRPALIEYLFNILNFRGLNEAARKQARKKSKEVKKQESRELA